MCVYVCMCVYLCVFKAFNLNPSDPVPPYLPPQYLKPPYLTVARSGGQPCVCVCVNESSCLKAHFCLPVCTRIYKGIVGTGLKVSSTSPPYISCVIYADKRTSFAPLRSALQQ